MVVYRDEPSHRAVMFTSCPKCRGRMFWDKPEPQYEKTLGYMGICCLCGEQVFTNDLLGVLFEVGESRRTPHANRKWRLS